METYEWTHGYEGQEKYIPLVSKPPRKVHFDNQMRRDNSKS